MKVTEFVDDASDVARLLRQAQKWCERHDDNKMPIRYEDIAPLMNGGAFVHGPSKQIGGQSYVVEFHLEGQTFIFASSNPIVLPLTIAQR